MTVKCLVQKMFAKDTCEYKSKEVEVYRIVKCKKKSYSIQNTCINKKEERFVKKGKYKK